MSFFTVCILIIGFHTGFSPDTSSLLDISMCIALACLCCYLMEHENRRNFLWRRYCVPDIKAVKQMKEQGKTLTELKEVWRPSNV